MIVKNKTKKKKQKFESKQFLYEIHSNDSRKYSFNIKISFYFKSVCVCVMIIITNIIKFDYNLTNNNKKCIDTHNFFISNFRFDMVRNLRTFLLF